MSASRCQISPGTHYSSNHIHQACHHKDNTSAHIHFNFLHNAISRCHREHEDGDRQTITSTSTVVSPSVTYTQTITTTVFSTIVSTSTTTSVTTTTGLTTAISTTTLYAACATDNVLGPAIQDGSYVYVVGRTDTTTDVIEVPLTTAYDCCVVCLLGDHCQFSQFQPDVFCLTYVNGETCDNANFVAANVYRASFQRQPQAVSNDTCGQASDGGLIG